MCGRKYSNEELNWAEYRDILDITAPPPNTNFQPNYNIAPTHEVPVCFMAEGERRLERFKWGLIPHWAKDKKVGYKMFNARSETLTEKPSFKSLVNERRCVVPVSGFYEWEKKGQGKDQTKQAYKIEHADGKPMLMAGLWTENKQIKGGGNTDNNAAPLRSYTVITTSATDSFEWIHNRMPMILLDGEVDTWLQSEWEEAEKLISPFDDRLSIVPVSNDVGSVKNNYVGLLVPIS